MSLSEYELQRLANIERNGQMLAALGLDDKLVPAKRAPAKRVKRPPAPAREGSRKSSRIAELPAPNVFVDDEGAGGKVTLGGSDAASAAAEARSEKVQLVALDDEDVAPESEEMLFDNERAVYAKLREEKNNIARELDTAAYHVAQNRALMAMVRGMPASPDELLACWGWGAAKVSAHGERLLAILQPHLPALRAAKETRKQQASGDDDGDDDEDAPLSRRRERSAAAAEARLVAVAAAAEPEVIELDDDDDEVEEQAAGGAGGAGVGGGGGSAVARMRPPAADAPEELLPWEAEAYAALLAWKRARAKELGYNDPCVICHNKTLCELVRFLPSTMHALLACWGVGPKRATQHGQLMLEALAPFRAELAAQQRKVGWRPPLRASPAPSDGGDGGGGSSSSTPKEDATTSSSSPSSPPPAATASSATKRRRSGRGADSSSAAAATAAAAVATPATVAAASAGGGQQPDSSRWRDEAGAELASVHWAAQREVLHLPAGPWAARRRRCARVNGCEACARYVADGRDWEYAPMSQRLLNVLASPGAYGSHAAAHAAGWRWYASPNHGQGSHAHQWWPPQEVVEEQRLDKLPLGTYKALDVIEAVFS